MLSLNYFITKNWSCHNLIRLYIYLKNFQNSIVHGGRPTTTQARIQRWGLNTEKGSEGAAWFFCISLSWFVVPPLPLHQGSHLISRQPNPEELKGGVLFIRQMKRKSQSLPRRFYTVINGSINGELQCTRRNSKTCMMGP